ncbi:MULTISPECIES: universal stress protein [Marinobacterium]|jgi:universal stress protein A|uniref:Universal stress protein n=1 Tax=Marinobacterium iners DSM 11526 TaxID=1122198 RepID=A0A1H3ZMX2_9GAMM|nr:universal stress protein [Marinobacterium iners]QSR35430.1 universal stress protein UspA [Marinobacterium iners]SEA25139.1 universal stress protein A [Marinobacterium iners DSM 11526]
MSIYSRILLALDLSDESEQLAMKTAEMAKAFGAELNLIHVVEPLSFAYGGDVPMDLTTIQEQLDEHARTKLDLYAEKIGYPVSNKIIVTGHTETEIHRAAEEHNTDLVILGSHGRHGLALLLGSTANGVLHGAKCDVLAIRVKEED